MALVRQAQVGDRDAIAAVVRSMDGLIYGTAAKLVRRSRHIEIDDLVSEGQIGCIRAIDSFDTERGLRFNTYAMWWIRQRMEAARLHAFTIISTKHALDRNGFGNVMRAIRGEDVTLNHSKSPETVPALARALGNGVSVDDKDEDGAPLVMLKHEDDPVAHIDQKRTRERVRGLLGVLNERERYVIDKRFFLAEPQTLHEIAEVFGLSRERVRQIEEIAFRKMLRVATFQPGLREAVNG